MNHAGERRFVRRTQTADQRFEYSRAGVIAQSYGYAESDQNEQYGLPVATIAPNDQAHQQHIQRNPRGRTTDIPHQPIEPLRMMPVDPY